MIHLILEMHGSCLEKWSNNMTAHVYSPSAGVTIKLKAEDSNDPTKSVETDVVTTTSGAWESLIFDFANQSCGNCSNRLYLHLR